MSGVCEDDVDECFFEDIRVIDDFVADVRREVGLGLVHDAFEFFEEAIITNTRFDPLLDVRVNSHVRGDHACALSSFFFVGDSCHDNSLLGQVVGRVRIGARPNTEIRLLQVSISGIAQKAKILVDKLIGLHTKDAGNLAQVAAQIDGSGENLGIPFFDSREVLEPDVRP